MAVEIKDESKDSRACLNVSTTGPKRQVMVFLWGDGEDIEVHYHCASEHEEEHCLRKIVAAGILERNGYVHHSDFSNGVDAAAVFVPRRSL